MAGYLYAPPIWDDDAYDPNLHDHSIFIQGLVINPIAVTAPIESIMLGGSVAINTPITESEINYAGCKANSFLQDYYYRIHITPAIIDVGKMLSAQTHEVLIWNAYFIPQTLTDILPANAEGIEVVPSSTPDVYTAMQEKSFDVTISMLGPSDIDATYNFVFSPMTPVLTIIGSRSVTWYFMPQRQHREALEWLTDIMRSYNGEQRFALREAPRQTLSYAHHYSEQEFSQAKTMLHAWANLTFGVPVWKDMQSIGAVASGAVSIDVDTTERDYRDDDTVLIYESISNYEAVQTGAITDTAVGLKIPTAHDFTDAYIMPMREGKLLSGANFSRTSGDLALGNVDFTITNSKDLALSTQPQYRGFDVFTDCRVLLGKLPENVSRETLNIDSGKNRIFTDPVQSYPIHQQTLTWLCKDRSELWDARTWLHSRYGKQRSFWLPSWNKDFIVQDVVGDASIKIEVTATNYRVFREISDIMLLLKDGTRFYRRILGATLEVNGNESLEIDTVLGQIVNPEDVDILCFITHARLNSDRIEIQHLDGGVAAIVVPIITVSPDESA